MPAKRACQPPHTDAHNTAGAADLSRLHDRDACATVNGTRVAPELDAHGAYRTQGTAHTSEQTWRNTISALRLCSLHVRVFVCVQYSVLIMTDRLAQQRSLLNRLKDSEYPDMLLTSIGDKVLRAVTGKRQHLLHHFKERSTLAFVFPVQCAPAALPYLFCKSAGLVQH